MTLVLELDLGDAVAADPGGADCSLLVRALPHSVKRMASSRVHLPAPLAP